MCFSAIQWPNRVLAESQRNCSQVPPQHYGVYPKISLQSILLHQCVQESHGFLPPQPFYFGSTCICRIRERERERKDIIHAHAISPLYNAIPKEHQKKKLMQTNTNTYTYLLTPYHTAPCCLSLCSQVQFPAGVPHAFLSFGVPPASAGCDRGGCAFFHAHCGESSCGYLLHQAP